MHKNMESLQCTLEINKILLIFPHLGEKRMKENISRFLGTGQEYRNKNISFKQNKPLVLCPFNKGRLWISVFQGSYTNILERTP